MSSLSLPKQKKKNADQAAVFFCMARKDFEKYVVEVGGTRGRSARKGTSPKQGKKMLVSSDCVVKHIFRPSQQPPGPRTPRHFHSGANSRRASGRATTVPSSSLGAVKNTVAGVAHRHRSTSSRMHRAWRSGCSRAGPSHFSIAPIRYRYTAGGSKVGSAASAQVSPPIWTTGK